jgi:hypothetical protein
MHTASSRVTSSIFGLHSFQYRGDFLKRGSCLKLRGGDGDAKHCVIRSPLSPTTRSVMMISASGETLGTRKHRMTVVEFIAVSGPCVRLRELAHPRLSICHGSLRRDTISIGGSSVLA